MSTEGNGVRVSLGYGDDGSPGIALTVPATTFVKGAGGEPHPGIIMQPAMAREIAYALLLVAEQFANSSAPLPPLPARSKY